MTIHSTSSSRCPICLKPVDALSHPFCSKRCQTIDLRRWLDERYRVPLSSDQWIDDDQTIDTHVDHEKL